MPKIMKNGLEYGGGGMTWNTIVEDATTISSSSAIMSASDFANVNELLSVITFKYDSYPETYTWSQTYRQPTLTKMRSAGGTQILIAKLTGMVFSYLTYNSNGLFLTNLAADSNTHINTIKASVYYR